MKYFSDAKFTKLLHNQNHFTTKMRRRRAAPKHESARQNVTSLVHDRLRNVADDAAHTIFRQLPSFLSRNCIAKWLTVVVEADVEESAFNTIARGRKRIVGRLD